MRLLQTLGIASKGTVFEQAIVAPSEKEARFNELTLQGYTLLCKHIHKDIYLFRLKDNFIMADISSHIGTLQAPRLVGN